jgi:hypothetical protein
MTSKLTQGKIPANTACPFSDGCKEHAGGACAHKGADHPVAFSCGYARLFNLSEKPISSVLAKA